MKYSMIVILIVFLIAFAKDVYVVIKDNSTYDKKIRFVAIVIDIFLLFMFLVALILSIIFLDKIKIYFNSKVLSIVFILMISVIFILKTIHVAIFLKKTSIKSQSLESKDIN